MQIFTNKIKNLIDFYLHINKVHGLLNIIVYKKQELNSEIITAIKRETSQTISTHSQGEIIRYDVI